MKVGKVKDCKHLYERLDPTYVGESWGLVDTKGNLVTAIYHI